MASIKPIELRRPTAWPPMVRVSGRVLAFALTALIANPVQAAEPEMTESGKAAMARAKHQQEVEAAQRDRVLAQCGLSSGSVQYPGVFVFDGDPITTEQTDFAVKTWTGGCLDGKRDGRGQLVTRQDQRSDVMIRTSLEKSEGSFVRGRKLGLWCTLESQNFVEQLPEHKNERVSDGQTGCRLLGDDGDGSYPVRKRPDGRWEFVDWQNRPLSPAVIVDAGVVEAESERLISEGSAGKTGLKVRAFTLESEALDDLVAGTRLRMAASTGPVPVQGKRVALLLSSRSIAEIERFRQERQAFIDATANLPAPSAPKKAKPAGSGPDAALEAMTGPVNEAMVERARFIDVSRPERLLNRVATSIRRYAREVVPVDDLSGLTKGEFDYAVVLDWRSLSRLDLLDKYPDLPPGPEYGENEASRVAGESISGFIISPKLEILLFSGGNPRTVNKTKACTRSRTADTCARDYLKILADFYEARWGPQDPRYDQITWWFEKP